MKALKLSKPGGEVSIQEVAKPRPGEGEVLIKIEASGVCGTDVHICDGDWELADAGIKRDLTLGHEAVGIVEAVGSGVSAVEIGQRVAAPFLREACGRCKQCRRGEENHCVKATTLGMSHDGSHADYVVAVAEFVVPVPAGLAAEQAAPLACSGMSALGALRHASVGVGTVLGVIGVGGQGHYAIQLGKIMGAKVVAMEIGAEKLQLASELGADLTYDVSSPSVVPEIMACECDVVMVTAPTHEAHQLAVMITTNGGVISLCAVPGGETPLSMTALGFKGINLLTQAVATRQELIDVMRLAADGKIRSEVETRPLSLGAEAISDLRNWSIVGRVVLVPD